jgi:hypothetical protein
MSTQLTAKTTRSGAVSTGTTSGLSNPRYDSSRGSSNDDTTATTSAATATRAHHRQRGEGSDPFGVSSRMKPTQAIHNGSLRLV